MENKIKPVSNRKYRRHLYWWSGDSWVPYKQGVHATHTNKMSKDPNDDDYEQQPATGAAPARHRDPAPATSPVDNSLKSAQAAVREIGAIWPLWNYRAVDQHPQGDELLRKYPDAFIHVPSLYTLDGVNHMYPDGTAFTNGNITAMYFRTLLHRIVRLEGRIEMNLKQMFEKLMEEITRPKKTWNEALWQLDDTTK